MADLVRDRLQSSLGTAYTLERELGGGGMSHVFLANEARLGRRVVVKLLPRELAGAVSVARFEREIATAARLQHPHIVPVLGAGEVDGLPYFTMPFVEGESLRARLARGVPDLREAVALLRDVAKALAYAHEKGVVHRDVKPENVLITGGAAAVTDFGVAKAVSSATQGDAPFTPSSAGLTGLGVALGTPAYMSPEQAAADPHVDPRSDLYAWGVVAYELLTGRTPFAGRSPSATMAAHVAEAPPSLDALRPGLPRPLVTLVMRCLEKRPDDRPPTAQAVLDALDAVTTPSGGPLPAARRARRAWGALAAGVAALALLGGWYASSRPAAASDAVAPAGRDRVVIAPFENLTGDPSLDVVGRIAADWLTHGIAQAESLDVVSSATVAMAVADARGSYADVVRRLATSTDATVLVSGSMVRRGDSLVLQAQLTEPRTGRLTGSVDPVSGPASDPMRAIDALRERVVGAVASSGEGEGGVAEHAPTYSAYREFLAGREQFERFQDYRAAIPYFEHAVALDSTFAPALLFLAVAHSNLGASATTDSLARRLDGMRDRLSPTGRDMHAWLHAVLRGDWHETVRRQQAIAARDPRAPLPHYLIGLHSLRQLRADVALPALLAADSGMSARGWAPQLNALAEAYHQAGRHAEELATAERGRRLFPTSRALLARGLRAHAALHRPAAALALADTVLATSTDTLARDLAYLVTGAAEFRAHGDSATARAIAARMLAWHAERRPRVLAPPYAERVAAAWREAGRLDSAEHYLAVAARDTACCAVAELAAVRFARTGDRAALLRVADSLGASRQRWQLGRHHYAQAGLVALLDRERALTLLQLAVQEGYSMSALHYLPLLAPLRGHPRFEQFVTPRR